MNLYIIYDIDSYRFYKSLKGYNASPIEMAP
jgi:hypothetical protein